MDGAQVVDAFRNYKLFYEGAIEEMWTRIKTANDLDTDQEKLDALQDIVDYYTQYGIPSLERGQTLESGA